MTDVDKKPGASTALQAAPGGATAVAAPGRSSVTGGALPRTTTDLAPGPVRVTADRLNVRTTPHVERDNVAGGLAQDQVVQAVARDGDWIQILFGRGAAYVNKGFVEAAPSTGGAASARAATAAPTAPAPAATAATAAPATAPPGPVAAAAVHTSPPAAEPTTTAPSPATAAASSVGAVPPTPATAPATGAPSPASATTAAIAPVPAVTAAAPTHAQPAVAAEAHAPGANEFATASGNAITKTTPAEAAVLNNIRRDPRRLDPAWLESAQHALGVQDATGAMNTETLRAMRDHAHTPKLDAAGILNETFLTAIAPGTPLHEGTETGENKDKQIANPDATTIRDRAAQNLGYADFKAYHDMWGKSNVTFLSKDLGAPAHPYLRARVRVAEAYLRNRLKGPNGQALDDKGICKAIGWDGEGNASYSHEPGVDMHLTHPHAMGHAIDIDPGQNPYFFDHSVAHADDFWVPFFERLFVYATKLYGGEPLTAATMQKWSQESSTEELFPRIQATSQSFTKLLQLSHRANGDESPTGEIARGLAHVGYEGDALKTATHEVAVAEEDFHKQRGRKDAKQATNLTQELVIALRDVAGLAWGGTEMSTIENGDFMHFDCRLTDFGQSVSKAASDAHKAAAAAPPTKKK